VAFVVRNTQRIVRHVFERVAASRTWSAAGEVARMFLDAAQLPVASSFQIKVVRCSAAALQQPSWC